MGIKKDRKRVEYRIFGPFFMTVILKFDLHKYVEK